MTKRPKRPKPPTVDPKGAGSAGGKVTREQTRARLRAAEELLLQGAPRSVAVDHLMGPPHHLPKHAAERYLRHVVKRWQAEDVRRSHMKKTEAVRRIANDAWLARQGGDIKAATGAERLRAQIEGTLAPVKIEVPGGFSPDLFSPEGLAEVIKSPADWQAILQRPGMAAVKEGS